jgi:hypothetical protein
MSTAGQVIQGISHTGRYLVGEGEYSGIGKPMHNNFQEYLYPEISKMSQEVIDKYLKYFVVDIIDPIQKGVFGANLNGNMNNGQLSRFGTCVGISKNVRYEYVQFKNALILLDYRLNFIIKRDPQLVKRYKEDSVQLAHFETLQNLATEFCKYLETVVFEKWETIKKEARKLNGFEKSEQLSTNQKYNKKKYVEELIPVKLTAENVKSHSTIERVRSSFTSVPKNREHVLTTSDVSTSDVSTSDVSTLDVSTLDVSTTPAVIGTDNWKIVGTKTKYTKNFQVGSEHVIKSNQSTKVGQAKTGSMLYFQRGDF